MLLDNKRIKIITGHYGSGKTEFACNYAIELAKNSKKNVVLADLDIVNPYFRSRERADFLKKYGITVVSGLLGNEASIDIPAIGGIYSSIMDSDTQLILDVGGDQAGARVLKQYTSYFDEKDSLLMAVINANRPGTADVDSAINHIRAIEYEAGMKVAGLINNTHFLRDTKPQVVLEGHKLVKKVSDKINVPILYATILREYADELAQVLDVPVMPIDLIMRDRWM
ncbi:MAG TPA: ATP-binding protein [Mogibacterium sp.]|nr:ATP-binding protein [Mogibacterium sp.]